MTGCCCCCCWRRFNRRKEASKHSNVFVCSRRKMSDDARGFNSKPPEQLRTDVLFFCFQEASRGSVTLRPHTSPSSSPSSRSVFHLSAVCDNSSIPVSGCHCEAPRAGVQSSSWAAMATGLAPLLLPPGECCTSERTRLSPLGPTEAHTLRCGFLLNYAGLHAKMKPGGAGKKEARSKMTFDPLEFPSHLEAIVDRAASVFWSRV